MYGEAEERICLDLRMVIKEVEHKVKLIVHNTKCSINVQGCGDSYSQKFDHLGNLTVGEYFASYVIAKVVKIIDDSVDISKLNDYLRKLATEGKRLVKKSSNSYCKVCAKDFKSSEASQCTSCSENVHTQCVTKLQ